VSGTGAVFAQDQAPSSDSSITINGVKSPGPDIKGVITARNADRMKITTADGGSTIVAVNDGTQIRTSGGLFSVHSKMAQDALLNGLPVTVKTWRAGDVQSGELVASRISFRNSDFRTASMIRNGTSQRFEEQTAATENLRNHLGDIDKYNIKSTTEVHFDTGKTELSEADKAQLCQTASSAQAQENALLLVVGYTDSTGNDDYNQTLSEKRAGRVINYLQQACGWKPYRMLTPTGMSKADPAAPNDTAEGKAQNRRVAVNVLVSKSVDGL
jgi:OOP family OmpA-OmpF porin